MLKYCCFDKKEQRGVLLDRSVLPGFIQVKGVSVSVSGGMMTPRIFLWILLSSAAAEDLEGQGEVETNQTDVRGERLVFYVLCDIYSVNVCLADISTCCSKSLTTSPTTLSLMVEDCSISSSRQSDLSWATPTMLPVTTTLRVVALCARDLSLPQQPRHLLHHPAPPPPPPP